MAREWITLVACDREVDRQGVHTALGIEEGGAADGVGHAGPYRLDTLSGTRQVLLGTIEHPLPGDRLGEGSQACRGTSGILESVEVIRRRVELGDGFFQTAEPEQGPRRGASVRASGAGDHRAPPAWRGRGRGAPSARPG